MESCRSSEPEAEGAADKSGNEHGEKDIKEDNVAEEVKDSDGQAKEADDKSSEKIGPAEVASDLDNKPVKNWVLSKKGCEVRLTKNVSESFFCLVSERQSTRVTSGQFLCWSVFSVSRLSLRGLCGFLC